MTKLSLEIEEEYPFQVLGINAATSNYRLCWSLNKAMGIALKRGPDLTLQFSKGNTQEFGCYTYFDSASNVNYTLIENKSANQRFLAELKQADFLLIIDDAEGIDISKILKTVQAIRPVLMVFRVDLNQLKNKQNLLLIA